MTKLGKVEVKRITLDLRGGLFLNLELPLQQLFPAQQFALGAEKAQEKDRKLIVELCSAEKKRSVDQNAYMWLLINKLAQKCGETAEAVYPELLAKYGQKSIQAVSETAVNTLDLYNKKEVGRKTIDGEVFITFTGYIGSSRYNKEQFSALLEGVIKECKGKGIQTEIEGWEM